MTEQAKRILADFQVRKSFAGKRAFRAWLPAQPERDQQSAFSP